MIGRVIQKANLLGLGVTLASPSDLVDCVRGLVSARQSARSVCAINVHTFIEAQRDAHYRRALNGAAIAFVDGVPIRWLFRAKGVPPPTRIHGADLTLLLLTELKGARHLFFGSTPETLQGLRLALTRRFPSIQIADMISPPFRRVAVREDRPILDRINGASADVLWVGLGAPKQELWMDLNLDALRVPVCIGVGAAFDILAGRSRRAPLWLQRLGLEWAWRLSGDPARLWRRYFSTNGRFLATILGESVRRVIGRPSP
jgi:N-acetylglucosaminyldiphosphoundecaprenol N-acetyl-beta-D-mannosaminyltransferase